MNALRKLQFVGRLYRVAADFPEMAELLANLADRTLDSTFSGEIVPVQGGTMEELRRRISQARGPDQRRGAYSADPS